MEAILHQLLIRSLSHYLQGSTKIPGWLFGISEPSTVVRNHSYKPSNPTIPTIQLTNPTNLIPSNLTSQVQLLEVFDLQLFIPKASSGWQWLVGWPTDLGDIVGLVGRVG